MTSNGRDSCSPLAVGAAAGEAAISRGIYLGGCGFSVFRDLVQHDDG